MATQVQFRGGNTDDNENFRGAEREVTVDTGKQTLVVHDNATTGGFPLFRASGGAQDILTTGDVSAADGTFTGDVDIADKIVHTGDTNTAIRFPAADNFSVETGGTQRLLITTDKVMFSVDAKVGTDNNYDLGTSGARWKNLYLGGDAVIDGDVTVNTDAFFVDASAKNAGIGTSSPSDTLHLNNGTGYGLKITDSSSHIGVYRTHSDGIILKTVSNHDLLFATNDTDAMRIDSSGRLLVGLPSARTNYYGSLAGNLQVRGSSFAAISCHATAGNGAFILGRDSVISGSNIGNLSWQGNDGSTMIQAASISAAVDGTPSGGDMPGRLVFSTTADGYETPNEAMRINSDGQLLLNTTNNASNAEPVLVVSGRANAATDSGIMHIKRGEAAASMSADDVIGEVTFTALDGGPAAQILVKAGTGWGGTSDCPGELILGTTADAGNTPTERLRITSDGRMGLGESTPEAKMTIKGGVYKGRGNWGCVLFDIGINRFWSARGFNEGWGVNADHYWEICGYTGNTLEEISIKYLGGYGGGVDINSFIDNGDGSVSIQTSTTYNANVYLMELLIM